MEKYIKLYNIQNVKIALFCSVIVFIPLFTVSLFYDVIPEDTLISFIPFVLSALSVAIAALYTIRFKKMIKMQEQIYNIEFQDTNVVPIGKTLFLSDEWLIWAGKGAFYRKHIKTINSVRVQGGRYGFSYKALIKTADGKNYSFCCAASDIKKIRKWKNMQSTERL